MRFTGRQVVLAALLIVCVCAAIMTHHADSGGSRTELLPGVNLFGGAAAPDAAAVRLTPAYAPDAEALVLIQGLTERRLVLWPLDGSTPPQEIDHHIEMWPLLPNPAGTHVLYGTQHTVMVLDVHARRSIIVGLLPYDSRLIYAQWSPDGRAIAYVVQTPLRLISYYTLADGSLDAREMLDVPYGLDLDVGWTPAGDPVSLTLGVGARGGLETLVYRYDPRTGGMESLTGPPTANLAHVESAPVTILQPSSPLRSPDGIQQIYRMTTWEEARYRGACRTGPLGVAGIEWLAQTLRTVNYQHNIAFEIDGLYMDRPTWLDDGRIVFRAVADPVCTALSSGFYIAELGHKPVKLVDAEPQYISDEANKLLWTSSYAISPDQTRLAWNETDFDNATSRVFVKPLDGTAETPAVLLLETGVPPPDVPFAFQDQEMILYFVWLS